MNWLCKNCETINNSEEFICEVCGKRRPVLKYYRYDMSEEYGTFNLQWESEETTEVYLLKKGKKISLDVSGSYVLKNCKNKETITLFLKNETAEYKSEITILYEKPKIKLFEIDKERILAGNKINVTWETINSSKTQITGVGEVNSKGNRLIKVEEHEIRLIAENELGQVEAIKTIEIIPQPVIHRFSSAHSNIKAGKTTKLSWSIDYAKAITLKSPTDELDVTVMSELEVSPIEDTTYTLIVLAGDEKTLISKEITIRVLKDVAINDFSSDIPQTLESQPVLLRWNVANADKIMLYPNDIDVTQQTSIKVFPNRTVIYRLVASNAISFKEQMVSVGVRPLPKLDVKVSDSLSRLQIPKCEIDLTSLTTSIKETDLDRWMLSPIEQDITKKMWRKGLWNKLKNILSPKIKLK